MTVTEMAQAVFLGNLMAANVLLLCYFIYKMSDTNLLKFFVNNPPKYEKKLTKNINIKATRIFT